MEEQKTNTAANDVIDLRQVLRKMKSRKKLFIKVLSITFVLAFIYIIPVPRYYECTVMLAPETEGSSSGGTLSSLASSFGVNLNSAMSTDAIPPLLYPDLMASTDFLTSLFPVTIKSEELDTTLTYYDYIASHQKQNPWAIPYKWFMRKAVKPLMDLFRDKPQGGSGGSVDPFRLSEPQRMVADRMVNKIQCSIDKKTDVISITVTDQEALVCASLADTVSRRLQDFITAYRTKKARVDMLYYEKLMNEAKTDYDRSLRNFGTYSDANLNVVRKTYELKQLELENDMQLKYTTYSELNSLYQSAKAKVQERTPAFTTLQCATVPLQPVGPKRMLFIAAMLFLAFICTTAYIFKDDFLRYLKG